MTRETKIGLLVGLAFVIVLGILLSDHLSSTNEPAAAALPLVAGTLRTGLGQPPAEVAIALPAPRSITPVQTVLTNADLTGARRGPVVTAKKDPADTGPVPPVKPVEPVELEKTYTAESGDSLGSIAAKAYGSGSRANRDLIVSANPSLEGNRDFIVAGRAYVIPTKSVTPLPQIPDTEPVSLRPVATAFSTYVVQPNDTLWSIATQELGTSSGVATIKEMNRALLNGSDRVRVNMKLRLPARKLARAN